jgi:hypothetical protein
VYPHLAEVRLAPEGFDLDAAQVVGVAPRELDPLEATRQFWEAVEGAAPPAAIDELLVDALQTAIDRDRA